MFLLKRMGSCCSATDKEECIVDELNKIDEFFIRIDRELTDIITNNKLKTIDKNRLIFKIVNRMNTSNFRDNFYFNAERLIRLNQIGIINGRTYVIR